MITDQDKAKLPIRIPIKNYGYLLLSLVDERKKFVEACRMCSECDIFNKCKEENRNYCEKDEVDNETN